MIRVCRSDFGFTALLVSALFLSATPATGTVLLAQMASAAAANTSVAPGLLAPAELERLLPATVFFSGQSAPLQLRNTAGYRTAAGRMLWAGLVDTSGYSTGVREKYQFYFVTEVPLSVGSLTIQPGSYGGGFLADNTFVLLDIGGKEIGRTALREDKDLRRPRPLQMTAEGTNLRLYLGRQFTSLTLR